MWEEVVIFVAAFSGALIGFCGLTLIQPVFMGDTGSLTIGGVIAVIALIVRKRAFDSTALWHFSGRKPICNNTSRLLQVQPQKNRRGQKDF